MSSQTSRINLEVSGLESNGDNSLEITVGENQKAKYLSLPLSYEFEFSPINGNGETIPISAIVVRGTQTIIKTPQEATLWKVKVLEQEAGEAGIGGPSFWDTTGQTAPVDPGEDEDGFNWLRGVAGDIEEKGKAVVNNAFYTAKRRIVFLKEES